MDTVTKSISELHAENINWLSNLDFYTDELKVMQECVSMVANRTTNKEVLAQVEHFQNQVVLQKEQIDLLRHDTRDHENFLSNRVKENPVAAEHRQMHDHPKLRDRMQSFERLFNDVRKSLYAFLAREL